MEKYWPNTRVLMIGVTTVVLLLVFTLSFAWSSPSSFHIDEKGISRQKHNLLDDVANQTLGVSTVGFPPYSTS